MSEIHSHREHDPEVLIIQTEGYINDEGGQRLRLECEAGLAENLRNIIIDFEASDLINSVAVSNLIAVIEQIQEVQGRLLFTHLSPTVREVFDLMGITKHVEICEDPDAARASLATPAAESGDQSAP